MKLFTDLDGYRRWMHKWTEPDPYNKKPIQRLAISKIITEDDDPKLVRVNFVEDLHKKEVFAFSDRSAKYER